MKLENSSVTILFVFLAGGRRYTTHRTGLWPTPGTQTGETMVSDLLYLLVLVGWKVEGGWRFHYFLSLQVSSRSCEARMK